MSELFLNVINMSISASWLVPAVLVLRIFWKGRIGIGWMEDYIGSVDFGSIR